MKKLFSLLKATMKGNSVFRIKTKSNNKIVKFLIPVMLSIVVMISFGSYSALMADSLHPMHLTYVILTIYIMATTILTIMEGIYKSQSVLYEAKDNDLLMSMPISKSTILFSRVFKLLTFQLLFNTLFMAPSMIVYAIYESPNLSFYLVSILMLLLLPIIPTVIGCLIGSLIKKLTTYFRNKKLVQTLFSLIFLMGIMYFSFSGENLIKGLIANAEKINSLLSSIYYPITLYINLITKFNLLDLIKLIIINFGVLFIFIFILSKFYFSIILNTHDSYKKNNKKYITKFNSKTKALIIKEFKRYISSPVYIMNTIFGIVMLLIIVIALIVNPNGLINMVLSNMEGINKDVIINNLPMIYMVLLVFTLCMTSITSSSISLEGKSFNLTKSLPVSTKQILLSKLLFSLILICPIVLICDLMMIIIFKFNIINSIIIIMLTILIPLFNGLLGLIVNLKYPKLKFESDVEVVKQAMSTMICVFAGMFLAFAIVIGSIYLMDKLSFNLSALMIISILILLDIILYFIMTKYSVQDFNNLNN